MPPSINNGLREAKQQPQDQPRIANLAEPIKLHDLRLDGFAAETITDGSTGKILTRRWLTSDEPDFHRIANSFVGLINGAASRTGQPVEIQRAHCVLLVMRPDRTSDLWVDTAAVTIQILAKRNLQAGAAVTERDIADVTGMRFPAAEIGPRDGVVCLFWKDWRYGLFFDFRWHDELQVDQMAGILGTLYRSLGYRHLYDMMANKQTLETLFGTGWFPFIEIIGSEFDQLSSVYNDQSKLEQVEVELLQKFDEARIDKMFDRWIAKPHFASKELILKSAIDGYKRKDPVAVQKNILSEIEGVLAAAYADKTGNTTHKISKLLKFAKEAAETRSGAIDTLFFPSSFANYLENYTYANFNAVNRTGLTAGSRNAVGHGVAPAESYTQTRALQALLTLDQLAFYL